MIIDCVDMDATPAINERRSTMCGIIGYVGKKNARKVLIQGLKRLEYRGYDSAGICVSGEDGLVIEKCPGNIASLEERISDIKDKFNGHTGIAHTRWATHGAPNEANAHPHFTQDGKIALVHNGIIENYSTLKKFLQDKGHQFSSDTDTEVLVHLIAEFLADGCETLEQAVRCALSEVTGTYGIAVISSDEPDRIVVAKNGSPLILGIGKDEYVVASDASAILEHTANVIYLNDNEMAVVSNEDIDIFTLDNIPVTREISQIEWTLEEIAKGGYEHFMMKEIMEQPESAENAIKGRIDLRNNTIVLGGLDNVARELSQLNKIVLTSCGTAWHAGLVGEYLFEDLAKIPTEVEYASEFRYRNPIIEDGTAVIAISQSGETADTLAAIREAKEKGAVSLGIVNVVGSTIARETDSGIYLHAGPEIGVASTKAFTSQVIVETLVAMMLGRKRYMSQEMMNENIAELIKIPDKIRTVLKQNDHIKDIVRAHCDKDNWLFLGRGYNYPIALEGALKLKEISYIHAEGLPAAEMKHGPIALISDDMPVVCIAPTGNTYDKIMGNMEEVRARKGKVIAIATEGDDKIGDYADEVIYIPEAPVHLQPLLTVIPLQLLAYHAAVERGCNVDKPRNLAKSVTVE